MARLHVFNPEHDFALAHDRKFYCPPSAVRELARKLQLLPAIWADDRDFILLATDTVVRAKNTETHLTISDIRSEISKIEVWGWDKCISFRLQNLGFDDSLLPSASEISELRRLSHRRISILCNQALGSPLIPQECRNIDEAMAFHSANPGCYFKLPWSSGGRGVLATRELTKRQVREWLTGAFRKQQTVIAERGILDRCLDFASLWNVREKYVEFAGFSISSSDGRGKYDGNFVACQEQLMSKIHNAIPSFSEDVIRSQKEFIEMHIAPSFQGKMGIDMMADSSGILYPCVEVNLRNTMGHVALEYFKRYGYDRHYANGFPLIFDIQ